MPRLAARAGEVATLGLEDIDLKAGTAIVRRGKGGKGRSVPFGPNTALAIDRYEAYVIPPAAQSARGRSLFRDGSGWQLSCPSCAN